MSIKKLMKIKSEWNLGGENIEFIKSEVHNESYFKSQEYASLVKVDLLKQVLERVDVKAQENLLKEYVLLGKKMERMNNKIMKVFVIVM